MNKYYTSAEYTVSPHSIKFDPEMVEFNRIQTDEEYQATKASIAKYTPVLEEELVLARPPHDDLKDALASAIAISIKPKQTRTSKDVFGIQTLNTNKRFGGISFRG